MSLVSELHNERKARLARFANATAEHEAKRRENAKPVETAVSASVLEKIARLERQILELQEAVSRQAEMIGAVSKETLGDTPRLAEIIDVICDFYGLTTVELTNSQKSARLTVPRKITYYLARKLTGLSMPQIGLRLGDRDHSTIAKGAASIAKAAEANELLRDDIDLLELKIAEKVLNRETLRGQQVVHRLPAP